MRYAAFHPDLRISAQSPTGLFIIIKKNSVETIFSQITAREVSVRQKNIQRPVWDKNAFHVHWLSLHMERVFLIHELLFKMTGSSGSPSFHETASQNGLEFCFQSKPCTNPYYYRWNIGRRLIMENSIPITWNPSKFPIWTGSFSRKNSTRKLPDSLKPWRLWGMGVRKENAKYFRGCCLNVCLMMMD